LIEEAKGHVERAAADGIGVVEGVERFPTKLAVRRSPNFMFLKREIRQKPGRRTEPGRLLARAICVSPGAAKAAALNQTPNVLAPEFGSPT